MDEAADRRCRAPRRAVTATVIRCFPVRAAELRRCRRAVWSGYATRSTKRTRSLTFSSLPPTQDSVMLRRLVYSVISLTLASGLANAQQPSKDVVATRVDSLAADFLARTHTPAISVAVLRGSDTLVMKGYGDASVELHRPATASTVYASARSPSSSRPSAIMRLCRARQAVDRRPDLEVPPRRPDARADDHDPPAAQPHVGHPQLHRRAGVAEDVGRASSRRDRSSRSSDTTRSTSSPATSASYSNTGYVLLGMMIEKVTGETYANYSASAILQAARAHADAAIVRRGRAIRRSPRIAAGPGRAKPRGVPQT